MSFRTLRIPAALASALICLATGLSSAGQASRPQQSSSSTSAGAAMPQEKAPSLVDPAGPTVSLTNSEPVFLMAATLNACGYSEGLDDSEPVRTRVRTEMNQALERSEEARSARDKVCLYIAQHRMTGTERDIAQYISLALYLTQPPELETSVELPEMPPDAVQVVEIVPLLKAFVNATDLHGIWLAVHRTYDEQLDKLHDPLSQMIQKANFYLKQPAETYSGRRFVVVVEPMLSPLTTNARVYGTDYVVVLSPHNGQIRMNDVRHTYLHYTIEPLLYARANAIDRTQPILKEIRDAPLEFRYRSDTVPLTVECLIKAIEARTMDTGIPDYKFPPGIQRFEMARYENEHKAVEQKQEAVRLAVVHHDMTQGFVLTQYFYEQLTQFEKDPASLRDTIGEMVYSMDVDQQVRRIKQLQWDQQADEDVLTRSKPHKLEGLDLAEAKLSAGDVDSARAIALKVLATQTDTIASTADAARAHFILARVDLNSVHPNETEEQVEKTIDDAEKQFQTTLATSKDQRLIAWSHIYLGRMDDLSCKRDEAVSEYKLALQNRDGQQDTRLAAERGVKAAYAVKGHSCDDNDAEDAPGKPPSAPAQTAPKPQ